jgi:hypothetical protein
MELRKVAVKKYDSLKYGTSGGYTDEIEYYGYFHRWFDGQSDVFAMIEKEDGSTVAVKHGGLIFLNEVKVIGADVISECVIDFNKNLRQICDDYYKRTIDERDK